MRGVKTCQILGALVLIAGGCMGYEAKPLTPTTMQSALAAPTPDQIRVEAKSLKHPLLKPVEFDNRDGLTPEQAAIMAVLANPSLRAIRDQRGLAAAQTIQAGILPNPQLGVGFDFPYGGSDEGAVTAHAISLSWDVTQLISHDAKVRAASAQAASVDLDVAWQEWQIAQAARTAVYDVISLQAQLELSREIDRQLAQNLSIVRDAVDRHDKTLLDLAAAESASLQAHAAVLGQERDLNDARLALNKALGISPDADVKLNPKTSLADEVSVPSAEKILGGLEHRRLDLIALRMGYQSEEETLRAAVLEQFPKINIGFNQQRDNTNVESLGFAVTVDLPVFDRNQGAIATEKATRQKLFDEYVQRVYQARYDVYTAVDDLNAVVRQIKANQEALPSMQKLIDSYSAALNQGNVDVLSYYTAISDLAQKQLEVLKLRQQLTDGFVALELAAGEYLSGLTGS
jgi:outer membrane protein TolC